MKYRSCKDCPQYNKCVTTSNLVIKRKRCEFADNLRSKKPLTHFDRIKAMSVEEMAQFLEDVLMNKICRKECCEEYSDECLRCLKCYLEREVQAE